MIGVGLTTHTSYCWKSWDENGVPRVTRWLKWCGQRCRLTDPVDPLSHFKLGLRLRLKHYLELRGPTPTILNKDINRVFGVELQELGSFCAHYLYMS